MSKILILFAHPRLQTSRTHARLIQGLDNFRKVTFHDLYEAYPDFDIDVEYEQELLIQHDFIIMQFPLYWYSSPPLLKQWIDLVLEHGWAYGQKGKALLGKNAMTVISTGGRQEAYEKGGFNRFSIRQFLVPFEQTMQLCSMKFLPPFVVHGTHLANSSDIDQAAESYHLLLTKIAEDQIDFDRLETLNYMNDMLSDFYLKKSI